MYSPQEFRKHYFDRFDGLVHLASCSISPRSQFIDEAMKTMLSDMTKSDLAWVYFEHKTEQARSLFAEFIGADASQIAILPNATIAAYQVISTLPSSAGMQILCSGDEFPSLSHIWLQQASRGLVTHYVESQVTDDSFVANICAKLGSNTCLVSVPLASYRTGRRYPIEQISDLTSCAQIPMLVDAYQGLGAEKINVRELGCDYLICGSMKYMLGLPGISFLYVKDGIYNTIEPVLTGWQGRKKPFAFDLCLVDFPDDAKRFEIGTPAIPSIYSISAAMTVLLKLDFEQGRKHIQHLIDISIDMLERSGIPIAKIPGTVFSSHVALFAPNVPALDTYLRHHKIITSPRGNMLRLAFHHFNTANEVMQACNLICNYFKTKS
ncbi:MULTISPECIES: aminotransferase class V-fold PLP-dependent enzyme [Cysteiniphilum]|uniref:aminotransferase class V-fold PLP-dependent enzyme n=1 Tax=Cysteiniphilum TaxID=2056696 RepID=UPI0017845E95|nr:MULTISPECIES: aminotransferase class V-fold PLP-dependent enzyme [Cysteiniphilum]